MSCNLTSCIVMWYIYPINTLKKNIIEIKHIIEGREQCLHGWLGSDASYQPVGESR